MCAFPSVVTAAKMVEEWKDQAQEPTAAPSSNTNSGWWEASWSQIFSDQSWEQVMKTLGWKGDHSICSTVIVWAGMMSRYLDV